jgi:hypothetical protein
MTPDITVERLAMLLCIQDIPGLIYSSNASLSGFGTLIIVSRQMLV